MGGALRHQPALPLAPQQTAHADVSRIGPRRVCVRSGHRGAHRTSGPAYRGGDAQERGARKLQTPYAARTRRRNHRQPAHALPVEIPGILLRDNGGGAGAVRSRCPYRHPPDRGAHRHLLLHADGHLLPLGRLSREHSRRPSSRSPDALSLLLPADHGRTHLPLRPDRRSPLRRRAHQARQAL